MEQNLVTTVPLKVTVEKLRGFVADHKADVESIDDSRICMSLDVPATPGVFRRNNDRRVALLVELSLAEEQVRGPNTAPNGGSVTHTRIHAIVRPRRDRNRRRSTTVDQARRLLSSLRSYLMAVEDDGPG